MTNTTVVRSLAANENGKGNIGRLRECYLPLRFLLPYPRCGVIDLNSIQAEHQTVMARVDVERAAKAKKEKTAAKRRATLARKADPFGFKAMRETMSN